MDFSEAQRDQATRSSPGFNENKHFSFSDNILYQCFSLLHILKFIVKT